ncbi:protein DEP1 [Kluyveromyces marxianus]|uniref:Protein DEP1 n=1 Tax=Kluyveromyces marxianus TaxID=4911 RepID=A0ABX6EQG5_KLUMA|nr:protein DEP1 [Kluyveromyces marxianus]
MSPSCSPFLCVSCSFSYVPGFKSEGNFGFLKTCSVLMLVDSLSSEPLVSSSAFTGSSSSLRFSGTPDFSSPLSGLSAVVLPFSDACSSSGSSSFSALLFSCSGRVGSFSLADPKCSKLSFLSSSENPLTAAFPASWASLLSLLCSTPASELGAVPLSTSWRISCLSSWPSLLLSSATGFVLSSPLATTISDNLTRDSSSSKSIFSVSASDETYMSESETELGCSGEVTFDNPLELLSS